MENPDRPVTGYPAPTPQGYTPTPPVGTAYPYAAPAAADPPLPNAFYSYQSNPYYQQPAATTTIRRATLLRRVLAFVIGLIVVLGSISFITWLVLRPRVPQFRVDSFSLSNFTVNNDSLTSFTSQIRLTARNPNKKLTLSYGQIDAVVFYRTSSLAHTMLPPFWLDAKSETPLTASFASVGNFIERVAVNGINSDSRSKGNVGFNLRMLSRVRFQTKAWRARIRFLKVFCGDLLVEMPSNGRPGALIGGPRRCRVTV